MAGVIWVVQLVHYALFDRVGANNWQVYHEAHARRMTWVVLAPMVAELGSSCLLPFSSPLPGADTQGHALLWAGAICAIFTWAVTFFISVPLHQKLTAGFDAEACRALVATNWWRTVLWTLHAALVLAILELIPLGL